MNKTLLQKRLWFLPKYKHKTSKTEKTVVGSGIVNMKAFDFVKTNSDPRGTANLAGNQSGSSVASAGGNIRSGLSALSFGKKKRGKFH